MTETRESKHEAWRQGTVVLLLRFRLWAIRNNASPLKVWDMLAERTRLATRQATSVQHWCSLIMREFRISSVDPETARDMQALVGATSSEASAWLVLVEEELPFLLAMARERFDSERAHRKAQTERAVADAREFTNKIATRVPTKPRTKKVKADV